MEIRSLLGVLFAVICSLVPTNFGSDTTNVVNETNIIVEDVEEDDDLTLSPGFIIQEEFKSFLITEEDPYSEENSNKLEFLNKIGEEYIAIESFEELNKYLPNEDIEFYLENKENRLSEYFDEEYFENKSLIISGWREDRDKGKIELVGKNGDSLEILKKKQIIRYEGREPYTVYLDGCEFIEIDKNIQNVYIKHQTVIETFPGF